MAKACKTCHRIIEEGNQCPNCKTHNFSKDYSGEVHIIDPEIFSSRRDAFRIKRPVRRTHH
ncbi:MAG: hypothetical protein GNW80_13365 [Asgard group archaeon]|nr:hypothetical protein [Asgard group archaeon]